MYGFPKTVVSLRKAEWQRAVATAKRSFSWLHCEIYGSLSLNDVFGLRKFVFSNCRFRKTGNASARRSVGVNESGHRRRQGWKLFASDYDAGLGTDNLNIQTIILSKFVQLTDHLLDTGWTRWPPPEIDTGYRRAVADQKLYLSRRQSRGNLHGYCSMTVSPLVVRR